jgi:cysteine desulfurase family protein (TIGR01976 family)
MSQLTNTPEIRARFPALKRTHNDMPFIFFDGPGGTQMPDAVIDAVSDYYKICNANTHGEFATAKETDQIIDSTRLIVSVFLGAENASTISFGQNMTSLCFSLAHGIGRSLTPGDEVLVTQLDHEANRGPWLMLRQYGITVREILLKADGSLDYEDLSSKINERTRLVAMGMASNAIGTVNDIKFVRQLTYRHNVLLLLDAVAYAPHFSIDVMSLGCDFLLCSAYKFYGPHMGILYSRPGLLNRMHTDRLNTQKQTAPFCVETGTLNHAAISGVRAAVRFISTIGKAGTLRESLVDAYKILGRHERKLAVRLFDGLRQIPGVDIVGPDFSVPYRAPTVSCVVDGMTPAAICAALAERNICAWDGDFYAHRAIEILGLAEKGGVTRFGISIYNTEEEVDFALQQMIQICGK